MTDQLANGVHLVGSVPLDSADEVFSQVGSALASRLRAIPDGETGDRRGWILKQLPTVERQPWIQRVEPPMPLPEPLYRYGISDEFADQELSIPALGYADAATESFRRFTRSKERLNLPARLRFQVSLPTSHGFMMIFQPSDWARLLPAYETMLKGELSAIGGAIPHDQLTIQWDMAAEPGILEGLFPADPETMYGVVSRLVDAVPQDIPVGIHLCYGSLGNVHYMEPRDTTVAVTLANRVVAETTRHVDFVHLPVPISRTDHDYFAPLADLRLDTHTALYLGLIHAADGVDGTRERMKVAASVVKDTFGIATECGFGRADPESLPTLLEVHRSLSAPVTRA